MPQSIEEYIASLPSPPVATIDITAADLRAAGSSSPKDPVWVETPPVEYLPGGIPLRLTLRRRLVIAELAGNEWGLVDLPFPIPFSEIVLFLAAHERAAWERPVQDPETGATQPLHRVPALLASAARDWLDATFRHGELTPMSIVMLAASLWDYHEATRVSAEKKTLTATPSEPSPIPTTNGSGSYPTETSAAGTTSSITSPSGTSTPPSTHGCVARESPASAPAQQPQPAQTSTADSPPSGSNSKPRPSRKR
jgi:hypothetical protein